MKRSHKPRLGWYALALLLPAALLTAAYALEGFAPFGDKSILTYDMSTQYVEFFCALKQGDLFFSWSKALGSSYIGVFSYYVSSPLSLLTLLVPNESMPVGLLWLTVLKFGLAGLAGFSFFSHRFPGRAFPALLCAVSYAMCAYAIAYSMCIMWLDGVIWLPLILLGIDQLLAGLRRWPLALSLAACFLSTWYISYMIGGFCCLWFVYQSIATATPLAQALRRLRDLVACALWALCLTAWLWLPTLLSMFGGKFTIPLTDYAGVFNFHPLALLGQLLPGQFQFLSGNLPFLFCGTLAWVGAVAYFFLPSLPLRAKLASGGLALALVLSLWLSPLDRVWHLLKYPNSFLYRYSFLLSFLLVFLAGHALCRLQSLLEHRWRVLSLRGASLALAALVCAELTYNAAATFQRIDQTHHYESYSAYQDYYNANASLVEAAQALSQGDGFYRIGATRDRGLNAPLSFGYPGLTHYSSFFNSQVNQLLRTLGFAQAWYWTAYYGSTPLTDALLSIGYVISDTPMPSGYTSLAQRDGLTLYQAPLSLPLVFAAPEGTLDLALSNVDPFQNQNQLFAALTGWEGALYTTIQPTSITESSDGTVTLLFQGNGQPIYADLSAPGLIDLRVNGVYRTQLNTDETRCIHYLGTPAPGETLTAVIRCSSLQTWAGRFHTLDQGSLASGLAGLAGGGDLQVADDGQVWLTATLAQGQSLLTTIPAEPGWQVWVDGHPAPLSTFLDTFLAVELPAGRHTVHFRYTPPGLYPGLALGGAALAAAGLALLYGRRQARAGRPRPR